MGDGNRRLVLLCTGLAFGSALSIHWGMLAPPEPVSIEQEQSVRRQEAPPPGVIEARVQYNYDVYDRPRLVGVSENVFLGRVASRVGEEPEGTSIPGDPGRPFAQFRVRVLRTVKASGPRPLEANESAVVAQEDGHKNGKVLVRVCEACGKQKRDEPLEPGREYVFATYWNDDLGWHVLTAQPAADYPVERDRREAILSSYRDAAEEQVDPLAGGTPPCGHREGR